MSPGRSSQVQPHTSSRTVEAMRLVLPLAVLLASTLLGCSTSNDSSGSPGTGGSASSGGSSGDGGSGGCAADLQSDEDNCGACGHSCLGGACDAGVCQPLEIVPTDAEYPTPDAVAADDDGVYFVGESGDGGGALFLVPSGSDTPERLAKLGWDRPSWIFPRANHVYVYQAACCVGTNTLTWDKQTKTASTSGGADGTDRILDAWLGSEYAFFGGDDHIYFDAPTNDVNRTALSYLLSPIVTGNATWVFFTSDGAVSGPTNPIFRTELSSLSLGTAPNPTTWIATAPAFTHLAANEEALFGMTASSIERFDVDGGTQSTIASGVSPAAIGVDDEDVYWVDAPPEGSTQVLAAPVTGGNPRVVAVLQGQFRGLWVGERAIVWSTQSPNAVYQLAK